MKITSTTLASHRFRRARRGYDPAEVDAVVRRLVGTLRAYEEETRHLEERLAAAEASVASLRQHLAANAEGDDDRSHVELLLAVARAKAEERLAAARQHADELVERARQDAARLRAEAEAAADRRIDEARRNAAAITRDAAATFAEVHVALEDRLAEVDRRALAELEAIEELRLHTATWAARRREEIDEESSAIRAAARAEARGLVAAAVVEADGTLDAARRTADALTRAAREEKRLLEARILQLRETITELERAVTAADDTPPPSPATDAEATQTVAGRGGTTVGTSGSGASDTVELVGALRPSPSPAAGRGAGGLSPPEDGIRSRDGGRPPPGPHQR